MTPKNNICKFITQKSHAHMETANFVFEQNVEGRYSASDPHTNAVYLVVGGRGRLCTDTGAWGLAAGHVFFTFAHVPFTIENGDQIRYMYISFSGGRGDELLARFGISPAHCLFEGYEGLLGFWQSAIVRADQQNLDLISESVLLYTLGAMTPPQTSAEQSVVTEVLRYIEENFTDSELNLTAVAEALGYSSKYISRIFRAAQGVTFSAHLTHVRVRHATFLMEQGVTSIKNVALLCGYRDPFYFSNVFKTVTGTSPREYIQKLSNP